MGWADSTLQHSCISLVYEQMPGAYEIARSHTLDAHHVSRLNTETKHSEHKVHCGQIGEKLHKEEIDIQTERSILESVLYLTNITVTTDLVTCIGIHVPLLISHKLPNTDKADAQKCLQLTALKKI